MSKIHAFKKKIEGSERYEKHIASLEEENQQLKDQAATVRARFEAQRTAHNKKRLEHYQGLMNFLSGLHGQLGRVQNDLLSHIGKLNALVMSENDRNVSDIADKLKDLMRITGELGQGQIGMETKTSGGLLPMLEDED